MEKNNNFARKSIRRGRGMIKKEKRVCCSCWRSLKKNTSGSPKTEHLRRKGAVSRGACECKAAVQKAQRSGRARGASWGTARGQLGDLAGTG